jgi:hypothetical protein
LFSLLVSERVEKSITELPLDGLDRLQDRLTGRGQGDALHAPIHGVRPALDESVGL